MSIEIVRDSLVIRSWSETDAEGLVRAVADSLDHIRPWLPWARHLPDDPLGVREDMTKWISGAATKPDEVVGLFIGGAVVGGSGLHPRIGAGGLEIGYWVREGYTGRGIASMASMALTDHAFGRGEIDRVEIHHDRANVASGAVPRRLGFSLVGETTVEALTPQQSGVHLIWRLTRDEWSSRRPHTRPPAR
jgi:ribosomal-protein-serine acetyltransferase